MLPISNSRVDQVVDALKSMSEQARPGDRLGTKATLCKELGVALGTLNEAVRLLQSEGWIQLRRGPSGGVFADRPSPMAQLSMSLLSLDTEGSSVAEAFRIRAKLDELLVQDAVSHATPEHHASLREASDEFQAAYETNDRERFSRANWQTHEIICAASPTDLLQNIYRSLVGIIQSSETEPNGPASGMGEEVRQRFKERVDVHKELIAAIIARDGPTAEKVLARHNAELWSRKPRA